MQGTETTQTCSLVHIVTKNPLQYEQMSFELRSMPHVARAAVLGQGSLAELVPQDTVSNAVLESWKRWSLMFANSLDAACLWALDEGERCHVRLLLSNKCTRPQDIVARAPSGDVVQAMGEAIARARSLQTVTPHEEKAQAMCISVLQQARQLLHAKQNLSASPAAEQ